MDGYESDTEDNTLPHHQALNEGWLIPIGSVPEASAPMHPDLGLCPADMEIEKQMAATDAPGREMVLTVSSTSIVDTRLDELLRPSAALSTCPEPCSIVSWPHCVACPLRQRPACLQEDGGVVKRIITPGTGWETPSKGSEVTGEPAQRA